MHNESAATKFKSCGRGDGSLGSGRIRK
jgi:hypothetical protein